MNSIEIKETIPVKDHYDVIVAGGGLAGVAAAVSARRNGCRTLLLEKTNLLGGLATIGLVNLFVPMCNGRGKQIIFGMAEELLRLSAKNSYHTIPDEWLHGEPKEPTNVRYTQRFCPQIFAIELTKWVMDECVDLLFDCVCSKPVMEGNHCRGIITESKSGREFYEANMVIDATGDADILYRAKVPTVQGENYFTYYAFGVNLETCKKAYDSKSIKNIYKNYAPGAVNLYGKNQPEDAPMFKGTTVEDVTSYVTTFQRRLLNMLEKDVAHEREIVTMPTMPQLRTTRRIDGDYTLTAEDVYKHFDDSVGAIGDFERRDFLYEIPYRTMTRNGFDNLITVGRCVAGEGYAWDVLRVIPPAILTGEVSGIAVALAMESKKGLPDVDMTELQKRIVKAGIMLHFDDSLISEDQADAGSKVEGFDHI